MTASENQSPGGCLACEYRVSGYCGNANPQCPNKPASEDSGGEAPEKPDPP